MYSIKRMYFYIQYVYYIRCCVNWFFDSYMIVIYTGMLWQKFSDRTRMPIQKAGFETWYLLYHEFNPSHSMNIILFVNTCGFHLYQVLFVVFIAHQECKLTSGILSAKNLRSLFPMWIILYTSN